MAELFQKYEVNRTPHFNRRLRHLVAASFVMHMLFAAAVVFVPEARNALFIAGMFSGAEYADEDYVTGEVRERAQIINISNPNKLYYPPGYFSRNEPSSPATDPEFIAEVRPTPLPTPLKPKATPTPKPSPTPRPKPSPQPTPTPMPDASTEVAANNPGTTPAGINVPELTEEEKKAQAEKAQREVLDKLAVQTKTKLPPKINVKPYKDLLAKYNQKWIDGDLDLSGTIQVTLEADRAEDGTLTNMVMTGGSATDPTLQQLATEVVQALSASHALAFLEGAERLRMTLVLDQKQLSVSADTVLDSEERAKSMANVYGAGIVFQRWKTSGKDEAAVWKSTTVSASGNKVTVKFEMPRDTAGELLVKQVSPA